MLVIAGGVCFARGDRASVSITRVSGARTSPSTLVAACTSGQCNVLGDRWPTTDRANTQKSIYKGRSSMSCRSATRA